MIISHKYKFIFIKTEKTAGTSIEIALSKYCGENDIITPIFRKDEKTRRRLGYRGPQNYQVAFSDYGLKDFVKLFLKRKRKRRYFNHISAQAIRELIGDDTWDNYYKFCFERNPWDRILSLYYWIHRSEPRPGLSEFLKTGVPKRLKKKGFDLYSIDGKVAVDRICKFENIEQELEEIRLKLDMPETLELPRAKSGYRKDKRNYRDILDEEQNNIIQDLFIEEIHLMGYQY